MFPLAAHAKPPAVNMRSVAHALSLTIRGERHVRWIHRGRESNWKETAGTLHFLPADGDAHTFVTTTSAEFSLLAVFIPTHHLTDQAVAEGLEATIDLRRLLLRRDAVLEACMARLAPLAGASADDGRDGAYDEAARRLVLRLVELSGGGTPDWHDDESIFNRATLDRIIEFIDAHLANAPGLVEVSRIVGLSPSHFAKKFRQSTGLSLERLVNRRRLRAALHVLRDADTPLSRVAIDLGFTSQSHFTRIFSELTGMTPARYRKLCTVTVG